MPPVPRSLRLLLVLALLAIAGAVWTLCRTDIAAVPVKAPGSPGSRGSEPQASAAAPPAASAFPEKLDAAAGAGWREPERRAGVDASNIYKNAFVLFAALTDAEKKMLRNPKDEVDADAAAALFEKIQPILAMLREAMRADYCDWGVSPITMETPLTYFQPAQDLGKLALWSAAYRMGSDPASAIEDLQTRARLGHHLSDVLIGGLVASSFESGAQELLRGSLPALDAAGRAAAADFLAGSTLDADLSRGFRSEAAMIQSMTDDLVRRPPEERARLAANFERGAPAPEREAKLREIFALLDSPERVAAEVAFIRTMEERMADAVALPEAEFQAWWKATQAEIARGHPLAQQVIPAVAALQTRAQQCRVERTLFSAGLDVLQGGPAQLARYRDPATGGALTYVPTPAGFDLRAQYGVKGKPVAMSFARPE